MIPHSPQTLLTAADVAARLGLRYSTIRQAMAACVISAPIKAGRVAAFHESDLDSIRLSLIAAGLIPSLAVPSIVAGLNVPNL